MLNKFPLWKNLLVIVVILLSTFYALPNLFGEDPAVQVSGKKGVEVVQSVVTDLEKKLADSSIKVKKIPLGKVILWPSTWHQALPSLCQQ